MIDVRKKINDVFVKAVWEIDPGSLGKYKSLFVKSLRFLYIAFREFTEGQLTLRATSLVYTTILSIVPLLAISFSVLKAFGVHNQVAEPFLLNFLAPLGARGEEITYRIIGFVENMKAGVLGSIGFAMLFYTLMSVIQKIEGTFNYIWRVKKSRSLSRKFSDYISVILISPVLMFTAMGLTASAMSSAVVKKFMSIDPFGTFIYLAAQVLPYFFVCAAFTFLFIFMPNTKVKFKSALAGGIFAGVVWETTGWLFAFFIVSSTRYIAIYSAFAILLMFMIWLYLNWLILIMGAQVAFYHQNPSFLTLNRDMCRLSNALREKMAVLIMFFIGYNYYYDKQRWTYDALVNRLALPIEPVHDILGILEQDNFIVETNDDPPAYVPARDIETIKIKELLDCARATPKESSYVEKMVVSVPEIDEISKRLDNAIGDAFEGRTVKSLVLAAGDAM